MSERVEELVGWIWAAVALLGQPNSVDDGIRLTTIASAEAALGELATIAREGEQWSQKRLIVSGPIRYDVLGAENVKAHETVHDFIEVLSPPSIEATNAISAHTDLMQRLSNTLEQIEHLQREGGAAVAAAEWLAGMIATRGPAGGGELGTYAEDKASWIAAAYDAAKDGR